MRSFIESLNTFRGLFGLLSLVIALIALFGGGTYIYNNVINRAELVYTVLQSYDLGDQVFSGLVIENRGRVPLTNVQIIIADLEGEILQYNIPGAHEPVAIVSGGTGNTNIALRMEQFSVGASLSLYLVTTDDVDFSNNRLLITSEQAVGIISTANTRDEPILWFFFMMMITMPVFNHFFLGKTRLEKKN